MASSHSETAGRGAHDAPRARQPPHRGRAARADHLRPARARRAPTVGARTRSRAITSADRPPVPRSSFSNRKGWSPSARGAGASCAVVSGSSGTCRPSSHQSPPRPRPPTPGGPTSRTRATTPPASHLQVERITPPADVAAMLHLDPATDTCVVRRHVRYIDGSPAIISDDYFDLTTRRGHRASRARRHHPRGHPQRSRLRADLRRRRDHHAGCPPQTRPTDSASNPEHRSPNTAASATPPRTDRSG